MQQLVMRWFNDGKDNVDLIIPNGVEIKNWKDIEDPLDKWLDIVQYGLTGTKQDEKYYKECNYRYEYYKPEDCYFITYQGKEVATITVICDPIKKDGYVHMVAAKPEARGKGIGNLMALLAVKILKENNMETAHLTTDDFRIPAIKTYLNGGFCADVSTEDFKTRWEEIYKILGLKKA